LIHTFPPESEIPARITRTPIRFQLLSFIRSSDKEKEMNKLLARTLIAAALVVGTSFTATAVMAADAAAAAPTDEQLAASVKAALDADANLKPFNLMVTSKKAEVSIDGTVDHGEQMAEAGQIAEKVPGVKFVINNINPKD
jgi:hyperosmotically inducible periplasmic protein